VVKPAELQQLGFACGKNRCHILVRVPTLTRNCSSRLELALTLGGGGGGCSGGGCGIGGWGGGDWGGGGGWGFGGWGGGGCGGGGCGGGWLW